MNNLSYTQTTETVKRFTPSSWFRVQPEVYMAMVNRPIAIPCPQIDYTLSDDDKKLEFLCCTSLIN